MEEKQPEMWLQGDQYRRANKDKPNYLNKPMVHAVYSLELKKILLDQMNSNKKSISSRASSSQSSTHSEILTKMSNRVERIKIEDENNGNNSVTVTPTQRSDEEDDANNGNLNDSNSSAEENANVQSSGRPKTMTQGDRLNAMKAKRQAQSNSCMPGTEKVKGHVRVKSVPTRSSVNHQPGMAAGTPTHATGSRPLTRMQIEAAGGRSPKRSSAVVASPSRKNNAVRWLRAVASGAASGTLDLSF